VRAGNRLSYLPVVYSAQNANQKEKFEAELKSQIKKLQRYRDDIKTWITNSDIKDKRPLTDARKQIETEMERFKVCEKEFKTKAFSKEGLSQAPKEDPKEKERNKVRKWIASCLSKISEQVDVYEAEIESTANDKKKKSKSKDSNKWEDLIERCRFHEEKLEVVLRLIDNDSLTPADVESLQDQLDYLLEQMSEGNYDEVESIDDEGIYEELGLDELQGGGGDEDEEPSPSSSSVAVTPPPPAEPGKGKEKKPTIAEKKVAEKVSKDEDDKKKKEKASSEVTALPSINSMAKAAPIPKALKEGPKSVSAAKLVPVPAPATTTGARGKAAAQVPLTAQQPTTRGRTAQVAVAEQQGLLARAGLAPPLSATGVPSATAPLGRQQQVAKEEAKSTGFPAPGLPSSRGVTQHDGFGAAAAGAAASGSLPAPASYGLPPPASRVPAHAPVATGVLGAAGNGEGPPSTGVCGLPPPVAKVSGAAAGGGCIPAGGFGMGATSVASDTAAAATVNDHDKVGAAGRLRGSNLGQAPGQQGQHCAAAGIACGGSRQHIEAVTQSSVQDGFGVLTDGAGDAADAYEEMGTEASEAPSQEESLRALQALNASLNSMPLPTDSERPKTYVPRNPYPTPNSFPQTPAVVFDSPTVFERFDTDTLFFIFYYQQGTYQQYLAARELKKQSWRYHKKYLTWFQRHEEPKVTADEYEQGTYVYFDYETGWCQRIKSEFTFEYGFLEDELQV